MILHTCTHEWSGPILPRVLPRVLLEMNIKQVVCLLRDVFELMLEYDHAVQRTISHFVRIAWPFYLYFDTAQT